MADKHIHNIIRQINQQTKTTASYTLQSTYRLRDMLEQSPKLTPAQIRTFTKTQEQKILQRGVSISTSDLYQEIGLMCPQVSDINTIPLQQVCSRLNLFSTKLVLCERPTIDDQSSVSEGSQMERSFFGDVRFEMPMIEEDNNRESMRDIFEECDNNGYWQQQEYFGIN